MQTKWNVNTGSHGMRKGRLKRKTTATWVCTTYTCMLRTVCLHACRISERQLSQYRKMAIEYNYTSVNLFMYYTFSSCNTTYVSKAIPFRLHKHKCVTTPFYTQLRHNLRVLQTNSKTSRRFILSTIFILRILCQAQQAQVRWIIKINIQCCVSGNIFLHVLEIHYDDYKPESDDIKLRPLRFTHNHRHGYHWEIRYVCNNWIRKVIELLIVTRPGAATKQYWIFDHVKFCHSFFGAPQCFWILPHCVWYTTCNKIYLPITFPDHYVDLPYFHLEKIQSTLIHVRYYIVIWHISTHK